jgi:hypothetical protein
MEEAQFSNWKTKRSNYLDNYFDFKNSIYSDVDFKIASEVGS